MNDDRQDNILDDVFHGCAVAAYVARTPRQDVFVSALEQAGDLVGCFKGGPRDLASNARHMKGFGTA